MRDNKKLNIGFYFFVVLLFYLLFELFTDSFLSPLVSIIRYSKYGAFIVSEVCWLSFVLLAIYLFGNPKLLSDKKEGFFKTLYICFPLTLVSIVYTIGSLKNAFSSSFANLIGLVIYSFTIGLTEELLVRGWILNKFFDKYDRNRKEVYLSIIFSALIFGGMHISNIWAGGQTVSETIVQVVFATSAGIFFGAAYFRTRNIMALAFVHGFYDFSILLDELNLLRECSVYPTFNITKYQLFMTLIRSLILIISALIIMRKTKTNALFNEKVDKDTFEKDSTFKTNMIIASMVIYILSTMVPTSFFGITDKDFQNYKICYYYPKIILNNIETSYNNYSSYLLENETTKYKFYLKKEDLYYSVNDTEYQLAKSIIDYKVINNKDRYIIYYLKREDNSSNTIIYYSSYLVKSELSSDKKYIKEFEKSFINHGMPAANVLGTIKENGYDYQLPLIKDYNNNLYLINKKGEVRLVTIDLNQESELLIERRKELIDAYNNKYNEYVPFLNFKNPEYLDAYRGINYNIDNTEIKNLLSYTYTQVKQDNLEIPIYSESCLNENPCLGNSYVSNIDLINKTKELYQKDISEISSFNINNGIVELHEDYWVYLKQGNNPSIEKISSTENAYFEDDKYIVEEKAGFIYNDALSKYSEIDNSIVQVNSDKEALKKYFNNNKKDFITFKHTFKYNELTKEYYYFSTEIQ